MLNLDYIWLEEISDEHLHRLVQMWNRMIEEDNNNGFLISRSTEEYYFRQLKNDVREGLKKLLVIENDKDYLGQMIITTFHQHTYVHRGEVSSLMLLKRARSWHSSLKIAECLIDKCEKLKLEFVTIDVRAGSSQEKLWKYLGFEKYGELPKYSKVNEDQYYAGMLMYQSVNGMKNILQKRLEQMYNKEHSIK